jgi:two-component sensor histidine kinase
MFAGIFSGYRHFEEIRVLPRWSTWLLRWRGRQPPLVRWVEAIALFGIALVIRFLLGDVPGGGLYLTFYPALLIATIFLGWQEASFVLVMSCAAGLYFFVPRSMTVFIAGAGVVGASNIAIIIALKALAQQLDEANQRQRLLFQELQHRVANTLQSSVATLERIKRTIALNPADSANLLDQAIERMFLSAQIHRRLHDPTLFDSGLEPILREVVGMVIDREGVIVDWKIEKIDFSLDQMSVLAMLVMEIANNSAKHVFQRDLGSHFAVELLALPGRRVMLKVSDDGPGIEDSEEHEGLGTHILKGLAVQIGGTLAIARDHGTIVRVDFPTVSGRKGTDSSLPGPRDVGYGLSDRRA